MLCFSRKILHITFCIIGLLNFNQSGAASGSASIKGLVTQTITPLMQKEKIPGIAVAVAINGHEYFYNFGVISANSNLPITNQTLFKLGSFTKTFTALLIAELEQEGGLNFNDKICRYFPRLNHTDFVNTTLGNLATHTSGLPLFPRNDIKSREQFLNFIENYKLDNPSGSRWKYSSVGMEMLGLIAEQATNSTYEKLLQKNILKPLSLTHTFFVVPDNQLNNYTQTYADSNKHAFPLVAADELISCSEDLLHYAKSYFEIKKHADTLQAALKKLTIPQYKVSYYYQNFGWEQYDYTIHHEFINSSNTLVDNIPVTKLNANQIKNLKHVLINKTGSGGKTDSIYVGFIPEKNIAIVLLANKQYSMIERSHIGLALLKKLIDFDNGVFSVYNLRQYQKD